MKLIFTLFLLTIWSFTSVRSALTAVDKENLIDAINEAIINVYPTGSNMREVKWHQCLADIALAYQQSCNAGANPNRQTEALAAGCNASSVAVGETFYFADPFTNITSAVGSWSLEGDYYNYTDGSCMSSCGNYIQLVWAESSYVGCSLYDQAVCGSSGKIITCYFATGANLIETPYTAGAACSGCVGSWSGCENDLCIKSSAAATIKMMMFLLIASLLTILLASV